jgi:hypothetical protein
LIQRNRFIAFFTTGKHKDGGNGQRDRRQMARAPAFAERRMINIFVRFIFVFQDPVVLLTLRIEDEWWKMKRRGAEKGDLYVALRLTLRLAEFGEAP